MCAGAPVLPTGGRGPTHTTPMTRISANRAHPQGEGARLPLHGACSVRHFAAFMQPRRSRSSFAQPADHSCRAVAVDAAAGKISHSSSAMPKPASATYLHKTSQRAQRPSTTPIFTALPDLCVSSLRKGHANLIYIVSILTDNPRRESSTSPETYTKARILPCRVESTWPSPGRCRTTS